MSSVTFNPYVASSSSSQMSFLDTKLNEVRMNATTLSGLLIIWADNNFALKTSSTISDQVKWQLYFAAHSHFDPHTGPQLGNINGGQFFINSLSVDDLAVLYRIINSYHVNFEKNIHPEKTVFQKHLAIMEARFTSSPEMLTQSIKALTALNDPALQGIISRLKSLATPSLPKVVMTNTWNQVTVRFGTTEVHVKIADLFECQAEAIVNAANMQLMPGSGICGAILRKGGSGIFAECQAYFKQTGKQFIGIGESMATSSGTLPVPARLVIHTVGPFWGSSLTTTQEQENKAFLYNAYMNAMKCAAQNNAKSIVFPSISTGAFHFPFEYAAPIAAQAFKDFAEQNQNSSLKSITLALGNSAFAQYKNSILAL